MRVLKRFLILVHRWLGVVLSVVFTLWFASGIVMMYWSYPEVSAGDRLDRAPALNASQIRISAAQAASAAGFEQTPQVRLGSFDGRPVYRLEGRLGTATVYADDGSVLEAVDEAMVDRAAAAWAGRPVGEARKTLVENVDQWTIGVVSELPLYKYEWADGQHVYVNGDTAVVAQYTTSRSRFWAYLGAIPHWLYFTPLRSHPQRWFSVVVWSSLIGTVAALLGVIIAIWMYSPRKRYRHAGAATSIPYRGWKRWHTIIGLTFGTVTVTWAFSGLLSMGPFPIVDRLTDWTVPVADAAGGPSAGGTDAPSGRRRGRGPNLTGALRGRDRPSLTAYDARHPGEAVAALQDFAPRELEYTTFAGEPVYVASNRTGDTRIVAMTGEPMEGFNPDRVMEIVRSAAGANLTELRMIDQYDAYYLDRRRKAPLPVIYARLGDAVSSRYYIDPKTARVVGNYNARNWISRWLYHGLHSMDFPWLYNYRPLWDIVVMTLMLGGTALSVTSLVLMWRVLVRKAVAITRARFATPNEDLAG